MSNADNQLIIYLTDEEKAKLKEWSQKTGKSLSALGREAILEYTDRDRTERVEHEVREINDKIDRVLSLVDGEHTHTRGDNKSVPEKARTIARNIYRGHDMPVKDKNVELAIENQAGGDDRTVEKYKKQLKKRELLFAHPNSAVWTDDKEQWVQWTENAHHNPDVHEVTAEYGISTTEYTKIAENVQQ